MFLRIRRRVALVATLAVVIAVSSCVESSRPVATGKGNIRGINAIVSAPEIGFLIEERSLGNVRFKATSGFNPFDDLTYNFNFDLLLPGATVATRLATQFIDVLADHQYTVILTGTVANPSSLFWEDPVREWTGSETVFEAFFAHLAPSIADVDVYFAPTGTAPVLGEAIGSLTNGARLAGRDFEDVDYEFILTPQGDPATILYQSVPIITAAQNRVTFAIFDPDPSLTGDVAVSLISGGGASSPIPDVNFPAQLRMLHAAFGVENVDGYFDSDFTNLIYSDIGFQELSAYVDVPDASTLLTLTQVGNSGATIHEGDAIVTPTTKRTAILGGTLAAPFFFLAFDEARPLETFPVVRMINLSINTDFLNVYLLDPGTPIEDTTIPAFPGFPSRLDTGFFGAQEGLQELTITLVGEITAIATPVILDLANGDIVDIVIVDTVDPTMVEIFVFDSQPAP